MTSYLFSPFENPESNLLLDSVLRVSKGDNILMLSKNSRCLLSPDDTGASIDTYHKPGKSSFYCDDGILLFSYMTDCVSFDAQIRSFISALDYLDISVTLSGGCILLDGRICGQYETEVLEGRSVFSGTLILEQISAGEYCKHCYLPFEITYLKSANTYLNRPLLASALRQSFECEFGKGCYLDPAAITG